MTDLEICLGCGKEVGKGTLLDEFPEPPKIYTTLHRLYLISSQQSLNLRDRVVNKEEWVEFASNHKCIMCASVLDRDRETVEEQ